MTHPPQRTAHLPLWLKSVGAAALLVCCLTGCETEPGDDFDVAYTSFLNKCSQCHGPDALGRSSDTAKGLDMSSAATARTSLTDNTVSGLTGNSAGCNGVPFVVPGKPEQSLFIAVLDADARTKFDLPSHPNCDNDAISDMTLKVNAEPSADTLAALKRWVTSLQP
ncbi:MAG: hypothetical protein KC502_16900 [Myxococcales bacterium]|nr:hypothetical protein [Myxococcales bacterium]